MPDIPLTTRVHLPVLPQAARRIYLVFNPTRAELVQGPRGQLALARYRAGVVEWAPGIQWAAREDAFAGRSPASFPHVLVLDLAQGALTEERSLEISSLTERPELVQCVVELDEGSLILANTGDSGCLETSNLQGVAVEAVAGSLITDVQQYLQQVQHAIGLIADDKRRRASWFFFDLDRCTEEKLRASYLAGGSPLIAAVDGIHGAVRDRLENRLKERKSPPNLCAPGNFPFGAELLKVTQLFFGLLETHLFAGGPFVLSEVEEAFEAFAGGALRLKTDGGFWSTQPSSGWYCLFAELALFGGMEEGPALATLLPAQRAQWRDLSNVLVRTQEIFAKAYDPRNRTNQPCAPLENLEHLKPADYCGCSLDSAAVTPDRVRALKQEYSAFSFADLAVRAEENAMLAFPGWYDEITPCVAP